MTETPSAEPPTTPTTPTTPILIIDDDTTVAEVVATYLTNAGYKVRHAPDGPSAVAAATAHLPDLMILDLMLPGFDGYEVLRRVRTLGEVPVIMLTALGEEDDRILGLQVGADDYVTKPFSPRELVLRAASVLRRSQSATPTPTLQAAPTPETAPLPTSQPPAFQPPTTLTAGPLHLDLTAHKATLHTHPLPLTAREFDLLSFLLANPNQAFTRAELMKNVWGWTFGDQSTVTVHIRRLREKIEPDPASPTLLVTVWGLGYRLDPNGLDPHGLADPHPHTDPHA
ncbi:response regulator transcription factor [Catenulispora yoronensis]|uniref:Response regulator transcription factor n=1 Tax=Catenulispora yoronensis TaxID=450799 RepID=A0ABP5F2T4_9ACTN